MTPRWSTQRYASSKASISRDAAGLMVKVPSTKRRRARRSSGPYTPAQIWKISRLRRAW